MTWFLFLLIFLAITMVIITFCYWVFVVNDIKRIDQEELLDQLKDQNKILDELRQKIVGESAQLQSIKNNVRPYPRQESNSEILINNNELPLVTPPIDFSDNNNGSAEGTPSSDYSGNGGDFSGCGSSGEW